MPLLYSICHVNANLDLLCNSNPDLLIQYPLSVECMNTLCSVEPREGRGEGER